MNPRPYGRAAGPLGLPLTPEPPATAPAVGPSRPSLLDVVGARMLGRLAPIVQQQLGVRPAAGGPDSGAELLAEANPNEPPPSPRYRVPILPAAIQVARQPAAGRAPGNSAPLASSLANGVASGRSGDDAPGDSTVGRFEALPPRTQTAIADVYFNLGPNGAPDLWRQITTGDWNGAQKNLVRFHDRHSTRRNEDANLLANDMQAGTLPQPRRPSTPVAEVRVFA